MLLPTPNCLNKKKRGLRSTHLGQGFPDLDVSHLGRFLKSIPETLGIRLGIFFFFFLNFPQVILVHRHFSKTLNTGHPILTLGIFDCSVSNQRSTLSPLVFYYRGYESQGSWWIPETLRPLYNQQHFRNGMGWGWGGRLWRCLRHPCPILAYLASSASATPSSVFLLMHSLGSSRWWLE